MKKYETETRKSLERTASEGIQIKEEMRTGLLWKRINEYFNRLTKESNDYLINPDNSDFINIKSMQLKISIIRELKEELNSIVSEGLQSKEDLKEYQKGV